MTTKKTGFTLAETLIAIAIAASAILGIVGLLIYGTESVGESFHTAEAQRLQSTLRREMLNLRPNEKPTEAGEDGYDSVRDKIEDWINSSKTDKPVLLYQYQGHPKEMREDGSPVPVPIASDLVSGEDYILTSMARRVSDEYLEDDLEAIPGSPVVLAIMNQLTNPEKEIALSPSEDPANSDFLAAMGIQVRFYTLPTNQWNYVSEVKPNEFIDRRPSFIRNMAVTF